MHYKARSPSGRAINAVEETLIAAILGAMTLVTFANVVARYVFNSNILWALEVTSFLFAWLVLLGASYCVGGHGERSNREVVETICQLLDERRPEGAPHARLITRVADRPGHDRRYAIDPARISSELGWQPRHDFNSGLAATVDWYLQNQPWCQGVRQRAGYAGERIGTRA